jgi:3-hydroxymyristoyl/3-hydroxydecanoyl-(acyl carrier protein) dehydratase
VTSNPQTISQHVTRRPVVPGLRPIATGETLTVIVAACGVVTVTDTTDFKRQVTPMDRRLFLAEETNGRVLA